MTQGSSPTGAEPEGESSILTAQVTDFTNNTVWSVPIVEEVRIWHDDKIALLWSCAKTQKDHHDEALLVSYNFSTGYEREVLKVSRKFVSEEMVSRLMSKLDIPF